MDDLEVWTPRCGGLGRELVSSQQRLALHWLYTATGRSRSLGFSPDRRLDLDALSRKHLMPTSRKRRPTHPGEILREDVLPAAGLTQDKPARLLNVSRRTVREILHE